MPGPDADASPRNIATADVFQPLLAPARDKGAWGGRGSGKSHFFAGLMVGDCLSAPGDHGGEGMRAVCIRQVQKDLAHSAKALIEAKLRSLRLGAPDGFRVFKHVIATPGDGIILFQGMQDHSAESIKSLEGFTRAWWEEAQTATAHSIGMLRPTMRAPGSQMWWSWNPRRKGDPVDAMLRGGEIPTGAAVVKVNWRDNPWFTAELDQERRDCLRIHPERYDHVWEGDYAGAAEGAYFARSLADVRTEGRNGRVAFDPLMTVRLFCDIGGTGARADAFAMWPAQFIGREIRARDYSEAVGQPLAAHLAWLRTKGYGPDRAEFWLPHDGATHDRVFAVSYESALRDAGYRVNIVPNLGKGAAAARIEAVRRILPQVWFDEASTTAGRDALGWYHERRDDHRAIGLGPEHDWSSHAADAFGLLAIAYDAPRPASKIAYSNRGIV